MSNNDITVKNINLVREMIEKKECLDKPFFATSKYIEGIITDYDHFPYTRYFRGRYNYDKPIVSEREAGYRVRHDNNINKTCSYVIDDDKPNVCFQDACSVVFPCNPYNALENPVKDGLYPTKKCFNIYR